MDILKEFIDKLADPIIDRAVNSIRSRDDAERYYDQLQIVINILDKINRKINTRYKLKKRSKRAKQPKVTLSMIQGYSDNAPFDPYDYTTINDESSIGSSADASTVNNNESPYRCHVL
jgi:hypothetical protein